MSTTSSRFPRWRSITRGSSVHFSDRSARASLTGFVSVNALALLSYKTGSLNLFQLAKDSAISAAGPVRRDSKSEESRAKRQACIINRKSKDGLGICSVAINSGHQSLLLYTWRVSSEERSVLQREWNCTFQSCRRICFPVDKRDHFKK